MVLGKKVEGEIYFSEFVPIKNLPEFIFGNSTNLAISVSSKWSPNLLLPNQKGAPLLLVKLSRGMSRASEKYWFEVKKMKEGGSIANL